MQTSTDKFRVPSLPGRRIERRKYIQKISLNVLESFSQTLDLNPVKYVWNDSKKDKNAMSRLKLFYQEELEKRYFFVFNFEFKFSFTKTLCVRSDLLTIMFTWPACRIHLLHLNVIFFLSCLGDDYQVSRRACGTLPCRLCPSLRAGAGKPTRECTWVKGREAKSKISWLTVSALRKQPSRSDLLSHSTLLWFESLGSPSVCSEAKAFPR